MAFSLTAPHVAPAVWTFAVTTADRRVGRDLPGFDITVESLLGYSAFEFADIFLQGFRPFQVGIGAVEKNPQLIRLGPEFMSDFGSVRVEVVVQCLEFGLLFLC
jgi:hypothetical protein